jgi:hypothetical protein
MRGHDVLRLKMSQSPGCERLRQQEPEDWRRQSWTQHFRSGGLAGLGGLARSRLFRKGPYASKSGQCGRAMKITIPRPPHIAKIKHAVPPLRSHEERNGILIQG